MRRRYSRHDSRRRQPDADVRADRLQDWTRAEQDPLGVVRHNLVKLWNRRHDDDGDVDVDEEECFYVSCQNPIKISSCKINRSGLTAALKTVNQVQRLKLY